MSNTHMTDLGKEDKLNLLRKDVALAVFYLTAKYYEDRFQAHQAERDALDARALKLADALRAPDTCEACGQEKPADG